jgi:polyisoprenoid-binding protein YceI
MTTQTAPVLAPGAWTLDPHHSAITFSIRHLGLSRVRGRFDRFDVELHVGETPSATTIVAHIDMASIDTNNADRDAHLRSTDFFKVDSHPTMTFRSTAIRSSDGDGFIVDGELTLNGQTRPLQLSVDFNGLEVFPATNKTHAGLTAEGELRRSDFGIDFGSFPIGVDKLALSDQVKFELDLQFVAPELPA